MNNEGQSLDDIMQASNQPESVQAEDELLISGVDTITVELKQYKRKKGESLKTVNYRLPEDYHDDLKLICEWANVTMEDIMASMVAGLSEQCLEKAIDHKVKSMKTRLKKRKS